MSDLKIFISLKGTEFNFMSDCTGTQLCTKQVVGVGSSFRLILIVP